jgi:hypothetical protein
MKRPAARPTRIILRKVLSASMVILKFVALSAAKIEI